MRLFPRKILEWSAVAGFSALTAGLALAGAERLAVWATAESASALGAVAWLTWAAANAASAAVVALLAVFAVALRAAVLKKWDRPWLASLAASLLFGLGLAVAALPLGGELASGGWISQQSWAWMLKHVPTLAALFGGATAWWATAGAVDAGRIRRLLPAALAALAAFAIVGADHLVLLGTYPDIHLFAWGAALVLLTLALLAAAPRPRSTPGMVVGIVALVVACAGPAAWFGGTMSTRAALTMASPMAANLARATLPPVEFGFAERALAQLDPNEGSFLSPPPDGLGRTDWNVLWITVDTLRADALLPLSKRSASYRRPGDTPFLDEWLRDSTVFERVYAQSSATHRSIPPMFRSLEAHENALEVGEPLGSAMAATGRTSAAVVNNFFLEPRFKRSQSLLWGFDLVTVHAKARQDLIVEQLSETLKRTKDDGFFIWMHFYNMHAPGYDGKMLANVPVRTSYRRSLRWLDARMKDVVAELEAQGVADDTIVIFSADHGEGLGDNRIKRHGPTVYEEELRVPLAIRIPGMKPRVVKETVGNIDVVPTLWEALGLTPSPTHRGRSLVPAIKGEPLPTRPYYLENYNGSKKAVVVGKQKLIFDKKANTFLRFDLAVDPKENENLFEDGAADRPLLGALYRINPQLVEDTPVIGNIAAEKLAAIDPEAPGENLPYLIALAARSGVGGSVEPLTKLFRETPHDEVKLAVLTGLIDMDGERAETLVVDYLPTLDGVHEERFVDGLADIGLGAIELDVVSARLTRPELPDATVRAWLRWLERWKEPEVGPVLAKLARRETTAPGTFRPATLALLATVIGNADLGDEEASLTEFNRSLLRSESARVRYEAIQTAAALEDEAALPQLIALARSTEVRDRQATIHALVALQGADAVPLVVEIAKDPNLILDAIKALPRTKSKDALPFLQGVVDTHFNRIIRNYARSAIKKIK